MSAVTAGQSHAGRAKSEYSIPKIAGANKHTHRLMLPPYPRRDAQPVFARNASPQTISSFSISKKKTEHGASTQNINPLGPQSTLRTIHKPALQPRSRSIMRESSPHMGIRHCEMTITVTETREAIALQKSVPVELDVVRKLRNHEARRHA
jgi:hypothetical protein